MCGSVVTHSTRLAAFLETSGRHDAIGVSISFNIVRKSKVNHATHQDAVFCPTTVRVSHPVDLFCLRLDEASSIG